MTSESSKPQEVQLLNGKFHAMTLAQTVDALFACIQTGQRGWLATVNVAILMMMRKQPALQHYVDQARWVVADGQPLIWMAQSLSTPLPERVTGVDLLERVCERAQLESQGLYFLGASLPVVTQMAAALRLKYPKLNIQFSDGYFQGAQEKIRVQQIAQSGASILIVGMGVPKQESFIENHWANLGVNVAIGVGGSFDVLAGMKKRAPLWMQTMGLEWFYRLMQEPKRLWKRYLVTNIQFLVLWGRTLLKAKMG